MSELEAKGFKRTYLGTLEVWETDSSYVVRVDMNGRQQVLPITMTIEQVGLMIASTYTDKLTIEQELKHLES